MSGPLRFAPHLRPMVWGGRRLIDGLGRAAPDGAVYGESWDVSDHASHSSVLLNTTRAGRTLRDLVRENPGDLLGRSDLTAFPWLIKFLDAADLLSVQVHPDDKQAADLLPGESGKTEAWFVLDAAPGSRVYAGLLPGVDEPALRSALAAGTVAGCLHSFAPRPGDCVFLPAGTVHAVGGGVLFAEIQQTSDATFRLFDWNRRDALGMSRPLHVEQALACIDWTRGPVEPVRVAGFPSGPARTELVRCGYFSLDYVRATEAVVSGGTGRLRAMVGLHGSGDVRGPGWAESLSAGVTLVFPAASPAVEVVPRGEVSFLLAELPTP